MTEEHDTLVGCEFWYFKNEQGCVLMGAPGIPGNGKGRDGIVLRPQWRRTVGTSQGL